jgi:hypothetical protein
MNAAHGPDTPSPWVTRFAATIPRGTQVLDLACGAGRHTIPGALVIECAVDRDFALGEAADPAWWKPRRFETVIGPWRVAVRRNRSDQHLHRPLLPFCSRSYCLWIFIYETFAQGNERWRRPNPRLPAALRANCSPPCAAMRGDVTRIYWSSNRSRRHSTYSQFVSEITAMRVGAYSPIGIRVD